MFGFTDNYIRVSAPTDDVCEGTLETILLEAVSVDGTVSTRTTPAEVAALPLLGEQVVS
jgi:hypothetical protein